MKQFKNLFIILITVLIALITGCGVESTSSGTSATERCGSMIEDGGDAVTSASDSTVEAIDISLFYIKKVSLAMCDEYYICYESDENEIAFIGLEETPFYIIGDRIYYTYANLYSADLSGENCTTMQFDDDTIIHVLSIEYVDDDWLYCLATKKENISEFEKDEFSLDDEAGFEYVEKLYRIKADFSEYQLIDDGEEFND